ncbi:MAG: CsbD family protein [Bacteroidales bacterium]
MDKLEIKGNWNELKGKLKKKYGNLIDDQLTYAKGNEEELLGKLQKMIGKSRDEIIREIRSL